MEIKYLGHAAFSLKSKGTRLIFDPFDPVMVGLNFKKREADLVCVSHQHQDHNFVQGVGGSPFVISGPGEYEIKGIKVTGIGSFHDESQGKERGPNTIYLVEAEGVFLCHLGDLGHKLNDNQLKKLEKVDVLFVPVGGFYTIDAKVAVEVTAQVEPKVVIPMHFRPEKANKAVGLKLLPLTDFIKEIGETPKVEKELNLGRKDLGDEKLSVVVLEESN